MPNRCCVVNCRGNYDKENTVAVFRFPNNEELKRIWLQRISREDFIPSKNSRVCERHFDVSYIETHTEGFDETLGRIISVRLERPRLKKDAVPSIFEGYPKYLSENKINLRENPEDRRIRLEQQNIQLAMKESLESKTNYDSERTFSNIKELHSLLLKHKPPPFWDVIFKDTSIIFLNLETNSGNVTLNYSVVIDNVLQLTISLRGELLTKINDFELPIVVNNVNTIFNILEIIETGSFQTKPEIDVALSVINNLAKTADDNTQKNFDFLKEQILLIFTKPERYRYSPETLIFASMFYLLSPVAYKFIRQSGEIILPHPSTIQRVSAKFNVNPLNELNDNNFLAYAKQRVKVLEKNELYVSLMIDEIHLKECYDYKGGNIVGFAHDSLESANSVHVFMLQSLFSKFKDVIHMLPVKKITADVLFTILRKIIIRLEEFGFKVIVIVTDNNSINRKCMKYFNNPSADYVYPHPCNPERPLFYCVDPVHVIKSVRNNWVNQKNQEQAMYYPSFDITSSEVLTASLLSVKKMYELESGNLLKYSYTLSQKALWPSSLEKQNVKLALQLINTTVSKSLINLGENYNILNFSGTAKYIEIFHYWFSIMNVKSPNKGVRLNDNFCNPLTYNENDDKLMFLHNFLDWLEKWGKLESDTGRLSRETYSALLTTTNCIIQLTKYCISELEMKYLLPGKIQTDELEYRFSLYRRMGGTHYHISMRQILEIEKKLRTCKALTIKSKSKGTIFVNEFMNDQTSDADENITLNDHFSSVFVTEEDISNIQNEFPILTFLAGYCVHSILHLKLKCDSCKTNLTIDRSLAVEPNFKVICDFDRGGLKYPTVDIVNIIAHNFVVINKLVSDLELYFVKEDDHRGIAMQISLNVLSMKDISLAACQNHSSTKLMTLIIRASTNTLLKNYCKTKNDTSKKQNKTKDDTSKSQNKTKDDKSKKQSKRKLQAISGE